MCVVDGTLLAPRQAMVRIATGRDAAETAFLDNHKGEITLHNLEVTAIVDGELPRTLSTTWYLKVEVRHVTTVTVVPFRRRRWTPSPIRPD